MAMFMLQPLVVDFIDATMHSHSHELVLEDIKVGPGSPLVGMTAKEGLDCCGVP